MDYLAFGSLKEYDLLLKISSFLVDVAKQTATIPGTGDARIAFTTVRDTGRFVEAAICNKDP